MTRKMMLNYSDYGLLISLVALILFIYLTLYKKIPLSWGATFIIFFTIYIVSILISVLPKEK